MNLNQKFSFGFQAETRNSSTSESYSDCSDSECEEFEHNRGRKNLRPKFHTSIASTFYDNAIRLANYRRSPSEKVCEVNLL